MRYNSVLQFNKYIIILIIFSQLAIITGCSKSADDLYAESKTLIMKEETFDKGVETLMKFEKKFPKDTRAPEVILALATGFQTRKNFEKAEDAFKRLIEKFPDSPEAYKGMFILGYMYFDDMKNKEKAKEILNKFITMYPDSGLTVSARIIVENIGLPLEKWPIVRNIR